MLHQLNRKRELARERRRANGLNMRLRSVLFLCFHLLSMIESCGCSSRCSFFLLALSCVFFLNHHFGALLFVFTLFVFTSTPEGYLKKISSKRSQCVALMRMRLFRCKEKEEEATNKTLLEGKSERSVPL